MGRLLRIAIALAAGALLVSVARAATASSLVELDRGQGIIFIQLTGPDVDTPVSVGVAGAGPSFVLEPVVRDANRTLYRTPQLVDGVYDVRIGQNASLHALHRALSVADLQLVEEEIVALENGLDAVSTALAFLRSNLTLLHAADQSLHRNLSALSEGLGRLQGGIVGVQSSLDSNRLPTGIAMESDLKESNQDLRAFVDESSRRFPLWALSLMVLHLASLGVHAYQFVETRRERRRKEPAPQAPPARAPSPASQAMEALAKQGPTAGARADVILVPTGIDSSKSIEPGALSVPGPAPGEPFGDGASPPGPPQAPTESPPAPASVPAASQEPEESVSQASSPVAPEDADQSTGLGASQTVTPGEGAYLLMGRRP